MNKCLILNKTKGNNFLTERAVAAQLALGRLPWSAFARIVLGLILHDLDFENIIIWLAQLVFS